MWVGVSRGNKIRSDRKNFDIPPTSCVDSPPLFLLRLDYQKYLKNLSPPWNVIRQRRQSRVVMLNPSKSDRGNEAVVCRSPVATSP